MTEPADRRLQAAFYYLTLARNSESADWQGAGMALAHALLHALDTEPRCGCGDINCHLCSEDGVPVQSWGGDPVTAEDFE